MTVDGREKNGLIALAAGGTGGHMFPAEALAQELKRRGWRVLLVTDDRGARYTENFPDDDRILISAASPSIGGFVAKAVAALSIAVGLIKALSEFRKRNVIAAVGFGGYPSFIGAKAASLLNIPYGVHEQNGVLGRANRQLVGGAQFTAHGFPVLEKMPQKAVSSLVEVGNPVRDAVKAVRDVNFPAVSESEPINILIFGGSQGASLFSNVPPKVIAGLPEAIRQRLTITHQVREREAEAVKTIYSAVNVRHEVAPFFADLPARIASAHLVMGRAGASTVTEISIIGRPSVLIPLGIAMDDHQTGNASVLSEAGAAIVLPEKEFTEETLMQALSPLLSEPSRLIAMAEKAKGRVRDGAAVALADLVEGIAQN